MCSLICHNGIIGGSLCIDEDAIVYRTNKLVVDRKYKNLVLPLREICVLSWKWVIVPVATLQTSNGERYRFIIFNKKRFQKHYDALMQSRQTAPKTTYKN